MQKPINQTILYVDDDEDDRQLFADALNALNDKITLAEAINGEKALAYLKKAKLAKNLPCLIVLDVNMPVMNGKELFEILKKDEELASIPLVVFTTSSRHTEKEFWGLKGIEMLSKPFKHSDLVHMVEDIIKNC